MENQRLWIFLPIDKCFYSKYDEREKYDFINLSKKAIYIYIFLINILQGNKQVWVRK